MCPPSKTGWTVGNRPPDGTMFMRNALEEITKTLGETMLIVAVAGFLFLGSVRTALVPLVAMPVSLIGAGIVMYALGFSLNLLTVLAVGLVVDDANLPLSATEEPQSRSTSAFQGAAASSPRRRPRNRRFICEQSR